MFNQKDKATLILSLNTILGSIALISTNEDPSLTVWYIDSDESLLLMVHPKYGVVLYNDEMHIMGIFDRNEEGELLDLLDDWGYDKSSMVWREIGIDQIDYEIV
ncbi:hypothetical protein AEO54_361 [Vibrio phage vB_VorS-PVo5]|nr:hypothetical protein AEO54_361 [Vibrio phage vB_VorS-PVo5]